MDRVELNGVVLECEVTGAGPTVVLIHGSHVADAFVPLVGRTSLDGYRLVRYHRRGFAGSTGLTEPITIAEQAGDCAKLLAALGVERAHVVGHSYGGAIALQLAIDAPDLVLSLALLEPAILAVPSVEQFMAAVGPVIERYASGDAEGAVTGFFELVGGPGFRAVIDRSVPGGVDQAVRDAKTFFEAEMPALQGWSFGPAEAAAITCPVVYVLGSDSAPVFGEGCDVLRGLLPQMEKVDLADATHLLQMQQPEAAAEALARFLQKHPAA